MTAYYPRLPGHQQLNSMNTSNQGLLGVFLSSRAIGNLQIWQIYKKQVTYNGQLAEKNRHFYNATHYTSNSTVLWSFGEFKSFSRTFCLFSHFSCVFHDCETDFNKLMNMLILGIFFPLFLALWPIKEAKCLKLSKMSTCTCVSLYIVLVTL